MKTIAGVAGNVLEWYDFAVFGFFSDVIGQVFFPPDQSEDLSVLESFAVFGGAFLMRPIGGLVIGCIGDIQGRKYALEISIFLMAIATTLMGCLPTYEMIGNPAILLLLLIRMLQGLSVGGQLMSSLVFTLEGHPHQRWGLYGSFVMAAANLGTLIGGIVAGALRSSLTEEQLLSWGWRIPFLSGILISFCGIYLKFFCQDDEILPGHAPVPTSEPSTYKGNVNESYRDNNDPHDNDATEQYEEEEEDDVVIVEGPEATEEERKRTKQHPGESDDEGQIPCPTTNHPPQNPLRIAFSRESRRSLLASSMVPMLWSGGFYLSFVWLAIWMQDFVLVPDAFAVNSLSLLLLGIWFPLAGALSDLVGRKRVMTMGALLCGGAGPILLLVIASFGQQNKWIAFGAQTGLSTTLACWGAPMCAWLVEEFDPEARLTSVSIGYNVAQAIGGGLSPFLATLLVNEVGNGAAGILLAVLGVVSLIGLLCVAPNKRTPRHTVIPNQDDDHPVGDSNNASSSAIELREIT